MLNVKIVLLGASGFIGSQLAKFLIKKNYDVTIFLRRSSSLLIDDSLISNAKIVFGDYNDAASLKKALKDKDIVLNLIPSVPINLSFGTNLLDLNTAISSDILFLEACKFAQVKRIIFASSGVSVYGKLLESKITESSPTMPINHYGVSKLIFENLLRVTSLCSDIQYSIFRISNPYGPGQSPFMNQGVISKFLWNVMHDKEIEIYGNLLSGRDFLYISDLLDAFELLLKNESKESCILNIGSGRMTTLQELLNLISEITAKQPRVKYSAQRQGDITKNCLNISLAKMKLSWKPKINLKAGLLLTHSHYLNLNSQR